MIFFDIVPLNLTVSKITQSDACFEMLTALGYHVLVLLDEIYKQWIRAKSIMDGCATGR
jgi:hypothetical protein